MGFIGLNTALEMLENGYTIVITQHTANRTPKAFEPFLNKSLFVERMDVTNPFEVFDVVRRTKIDSIISFAAPPARGISPHKDYQIYTSGTQNLLEATRGFGLRRLTLASSTSVYGGLKEGPFSETMPLPIDSKTQIEAFKKSMEIQSLHYASRADVDVACVRIGSIYGPFYYSMFNPMSRMIAATLNGGVPDFSDRPNGQLLKEDQGDWTYVRDLARGIGLVHNAEILPNRIYNVGSGSAVSNEQIFDAVRAVLPSAQCPALISGRSPGNPENPSMDLSRIKHDLGYSPEHDIRSGIDAYVTWLRSESID